ncbi:hypothetical protein MBLNU459_g4660t2 [Dothideomycetes sp. NU459]
MASTAPGQKIDAINGAKPTPSRPTPRRKEWRSYGNSERILGGFFAENTAFSLDLRTTDIVQVGDELCLAPVQHITTREGLDDFLSTGGSANTKARILAIEDISAESLKILGSEYDIHLGFWEWVLSEEAADELTIKSTGNDLPVFLYFGESSEHNGTVSLSHNPTGIEAPMPTWLFGVLQKQPRILQSIVDDPFCLLAVVEAKLLSNWSAFFTIFAKDVEAADSANITELDASDSDHRIFGIIASLQQDISLTLTRFSSHLEAHEGFLMYVLNGTKENWRPTVAEQELGDLIKSVKFLRTRLDTLSKRAVNILNFMISSISMRQAQLSFEQAERSTEMARLTRLDTRTTLEQGREIKRLTILAGLFLPPSTLAVGAESNLPSVKLELLNTAYRQSSE